MKNILDKYNAFLAVVVLIFSAMFSQIWYLFALYLLINFIAWFTGWYKDRKLGTQNSEIGGLGALKKYGFWAAVLSVSLPLTFLHLGGRMGINVSFLEVVGWIVMVCLMVNEALNIVRNLVEMGYNVPEIVVTALEAIAKRINRKDDESAPEK